MQNLTPKEKSALDLMKKKNFRGISKNNVMQLMNILDKVSPEVAKEIISRIPEAVRAIIEAEKGYNYLLEKGMVSLNENLSSCFASEDSIISSLQNEIEKNDAGFEEKKYYFEKMEAAVKRKESIEAEHKKNIVEILRFGGEAMAFATVLCVALFSGKIAINMPNKH